MRQLFYKGITFELITKEADSDKGPYYEAIDFPAIKVYRPNSPQNPSEQWLAKDVDNGKFFEGTKPAVFQTIALWFKEKEIEREIFLLAQKPRE